MDNCVPIKFMDEYEELEQFSTHTYAEQPSQLGSPTYSVSIFEELCKLSVIMDRIVYSLYAENSFKRSTEDFLSTSRLLHADLKRWRAELPTHLVIRVDNDDTSVVLPHTLSLL